MKDITKYIAHPGTQAKFRPSRDAALQGRLGEMPQCLLEPPHWFDSKHLHPEAYVLSQFPWHIKGDLTWRRSSRRRETGAAAQKRAEDFNLLMTQTAARLKKQHRNMAIVWTEEINHAGRHCHFLMGRDGLAELGAEHVAFVMKSLWERELHPYDDSTAEGIGTAVIQAYDYVKFKNRGSDYACKREWDYLGQQNEKSFQYSMGFWNALRRLQNQQAIDLN